MSNELRTGRETPPDDKEWSGIWRAVDKAEKAWIVAGPIHAAVTNWKGWIAIAGVVMWLKSGEIIALIMNLIRGSV